MAAVNHNGEPSRGHENEQLAEPAPSFTAVNGGVSPAPTSKPKADPDSSNGSIEAMSPHTVIPNHSQEALPNGTASRNDLPNGHGSAGQEQHQSSAPPPRQNHDTPSTQTSKPPTPAPLNTQTPTQAQSSDRPPSAHPSQHSEAPFDQRRQSYVNGHSRNASIQPSNAAVMSPQQGKRKRSFDNDMDRRPDYEGQGHTVYPLNGHPASPEGSRSHEMENGHARDMQEYSPRQTYPAPAASYPPPPQDTYAAPPRIRDSPPEIYPRPDRHQLVRNDYDQPVDPSIAPQAPRPYYSDPSEAHLANALQRENRGYDPMPRDNYGSPEEDDDPNGPYGAYGDNRSSQDLDRKRRKRVFSNRTKTGCMTCRRRKKKCDEQHPECKDCWDFFFASNQLLVRHGYLYFP